MNLDGSTIKCMFRRMTLKWEHDNLMSSSDQFLILTPAGCCKVLEVLSYDINEHVYLCVWCFWLRGDIFAVRLMWDYCLVTHDPVLYGVSSIWLIWCIWCSNIAQAISFSISPSVNGVTALWKFLDIYIHIIYIKK